MTDDKVMHCLDTSALINPWNLYWAPDLVPGYWRDIPRLIDEGRVVISEEVREEISKVDDDLKKWAHDHVASWHPLTDEIQGVVTEIMGKWGQLVDSRKDRGRADPFVIATAKVIGATVVTTEKHGTAKAPHIPYVCDRLSVPCIDVYAFVREARINLA